MTREQFEENNPGVFVALTNRYLNNPNIYAILKNDNGSTIAYKNPSENEQAKGATVWAESCQDIGEAYQAINDYIESLVNEKPKKLVK